MAKLGERVRLINETHMGEGTLLAVPSRGYDGIVVLDKPLGHNGDRVWTTLLSAVDPNAVDMKRLRTAWEKAIAGETCLWWIYTIDDLDVIKPPSGHVPGLHTCSKGCGFSNDHVDASAFKTGKYVCFQCSLWARKCEW